MISASCHCGAVRLELARAPETLTDCNCSICSRLGGLWAYYHPDEVTIHAADGALQAYGRDDLAANPGGKALLDFMRCATCGCTTHWLARAPGHPRMGVNARMTPAAVRAAARIRRLDGADTWRFLDEAAD